MFEPIVFFYNIGLLWRKVIFPK